MECQVKISARRLAFLTGFVVFLSPSRQVTGSAFNCGTAVSFHIFFNYYSLNILSVIQALVTMSATFYMTCPGFTNGNLAKTSELLPSHNCCNRKFSLTPLALETDI